MVRTALPLLMLFLATGCCCLDPCGMSFNDGCNRYTFGFRGQRGCHNCHTGCGRCAPSACGPGYGAPGWGTPAAVPPVYGPPAAVVPGGTYSATPSLQQPTIQTLPTLDAGQPPLASPSPLVPPPQALPTGITPGPQTHAPGVIQNTYSWGNGPRRS